MSLFTLISLDYSHIRRGKPQAYNKAPPFQTEGFWEDYKYNGKARNMSLTCLGLLRNLFSA